MFLLFSFIQKLFSILVHMLKFFIELILPEVFIKGSSFFLLKQRLGHKQESLEQEQSVNVDERFDETKCLKKEYYR